MSDKPRILPTLQSPHQLRRLSIDDLRRLAEELRQTIIDVVSRQGGHLASNLGVTELTLALHYVFDFARDRLLWDVGHQCYAHKLLTGRQDGFQRLRRADGISGFPAPAESDYDLLATGHAGSAISIAAGLAWASAAAGEDRRIVAVVGDASIVNGVSLEALNNLAGLGRQFLVVLNDNSMAIDRTRGGLAHALDRVRLTGTYADLKHSTESLLQHLPLGDQITQRLRQLRDGLRTTVHGGQLFETLGVRYFGPVDGHDLPELLRLLPRLAMLNQPVLLHVRTEKGHGCDYAVEDPCQFHSPSAFRMAGGKAVFAPKPRRTWTEAFADALIERARADERIVALTAAMPDGTGLAKFRQAFPGRCLDVGIAEAHAVPMAAGLAKAGRRPVVAIYSTFAQRAFDQMFQEVALQGLPVLLCMDRAGLVGADGAVHHGFTDIATLRLLPGMHLMAPADAAELGAAMDAALALDEPAAIRYPRDLVPPDLPGPCPPFELGRARTLREGADGTFLTYGTMAAAALAAADELAETDGLEIGVVNARWAKPLDVALLGRLLRTGRPVVTCEDHAAAGGFGSAVLEAVAARGWDTRNVRVLGLPDRFVAHASRGEQLAEVGLDAAHLAAVMRDRAAVAPKRPASRYTE